jgi:predicted PP-loop superfamily ATPase
MEYKQSVSYYGFNPLELSEEYSKVYEYVSNLKDISMTSEPQIHKETRELLELLYSDMKIKKPQEEVVAGWKYKPIQKNKKAFVAFSGGKDGAAKAILLQKRGYEVTLVRVSGLQQDYREKVAAIESSKILNMPLVEVSVKTSGKRDSVEIPVKNFVIMSIVADIAYANGGGATYGIEVFYSAV